MKIPGIIGQWFGVYELGPEYGPIVAGQRVAFRLFINEEEDGQFKGTAVDYDGFEANFDVSIISGFVEMASISFTKTYNDNLLIDDMGHTFIDNSIPPPRIHYTGEYNSYLNKYFGTFEVQANDVPYGDGFFMDVMTGQWEAEKDHSL